MKTIAERALNLAARAGPTVAGGQIIYSRGTSQIWINATWGQTTFEVDGTDGVRVEHTDRDFIFESDKLILDGTRATPAKGDRVTVVGESHGDAAVYEVLSIGNRSGIGDGCYRFCDPEERLVRVHGKKVTA